MRSPDVGMAQLRAATNTRPDGDRLVPIRLDLEDRGSIGAAAAAILDAVGPPDALVHNAGVAGVGAVEELPAAVYDRILATNFLGPVLLTKAVLPAMRRAGCGRIVVVSSQGAVRGMAGISAYSAAKGALERWAEALAPEVAPFGLGVTVLVTGTFRTDILSSTETFTDDDSVYAPMHQALLAMEPRVLRLAGNPTRFAAAMAKAVDDTAPFVRRAVGADAHVMIAASKVLPGAVLQRLVVRALGLPKPGSRRDVSGLSRPG